MTTHRTNIVAQTNLPFTWINAVANDEIARENLVRSMIARLDVKYSQTTA